MKTTRPVTSAFRRSGLCLLLALAASPAAGATPSVQGAEWIIDARGAERFAGRNETLDTIAGHVPGARNHPFPGNLSTDGKFLPAAELRRRFDVLRGALPPSAIVSMCGSGVTACQTLLALEHAGLPGARLYAGSWSEWIRDPARPIATGAT